MRMAGILSRPAEELVFKFRVIFRIGGILKTGSDIILVLEGYVGGLKSFFVQLWIELKFWGKSFRFVACVRLCEIVLSGLICRRQNNLTYRG